MKLFLIIICTILCISFCFALNFGISPQKIELTGKTNEIICKDFSVLGDNQSIFQGTIKWSKTLTNNLIDYNLSSSDLRISYNFPELTNPGKYEICLSTKISGIYYGVLMYRLKDSPYGIATWIELKINQNHETSFLSGEIIQEINPINLSLLVLVITLLLIFIILIIKLKRRTLTKI